MCQSSGANRLGSVSPVANITIQTATASAGQSPAARKNGLNPSDNAAVLALAERDSLVKPAFGLYPVDAVLPEMRELGVDYPRELEHEVRAGEAITWVRDHVEQAFAIGEIGCHNSRAGSV